MNIHEPNAAYSWRTPAAEYSCYWEYCMYGLHPNQGYIDWSVKVIKCCWRNDWYDQFMSSSKCKWKLTEYMSVYSAILKHDIQKVCFEGDSWIRVWVNFYHQFGGKRVYLYTWNNNQLDPFASELMLYSVQTAIGNSCSTLIKMGLCLCCLMTSGLSKDIQCHVIVYFSKLANHQIRHQVTHKVVCQPGDCIWSL